MGTLPPIQSAFSLIDIISLRLKSRMMIAVAFAIAPGVASRVDAGFTEMRSTNPVVHEAAQSGFVAEAVTNGDTSGVSADFQKIECQHDGFTLTRNNWNGVSIDAGLFLFDPKAFASFDGWNLSAPTAQVDSVRPQSNTLVPLLIPLPTAITSGICGLVALGAMVMPRRLRRRLFA